MTEAGLHSITFSHGVVIPKIQRWHCLTSSKRTCHGIGNGIRRRIGVKTQLSITVDKENYKRYKRNKKEEDKLSSLLDKFLGKYNDDPKKALEWLLE